MRITKQCNLPLSLGKHYRSNVLCDVVDMDASHVLLGRPWQFDVDTTHKGKENSYSFIWNKRKIIILRNKTNGNIFKDEGRSMLTITNTSNEFMEHLKEADLSDALIVKGEEQPVVKFQQRDVAY